MQGFLRLTQAKIGRHKASAGLGDADAVQIGQTLGFLGQIGAE